MLAVTEKRASYGSVARRVAVFVAARSELDDNARSRDAAFIDALSAVARACERAGVSDAALAAAAADASASVALAARVVLQARRLLQQAAASRVDAGLGGSTGSQAPDGPANRWIESATLSEAAALASREGADEIEAPRSLVGIIASPEMGAIRSLRAAFAQCDAGMALSRALGGEIDVLHLRSAGGPAGDLSTVLATIGGGAERERALAWSKKLRLLRACARRKTRVLEAMLDAAGCSDRRLIAEATAADAVLDALERCPDAETRIALFLDAIAPRARIGNVTIAPLGTLDGAAFELRASGSESAVTDVARFADAAGVDRDALQTPCINISTSPEAAAAQHLALQVPEDIQAPYEWPAPQAPEKLVAPAMRFSASRLNAYVTCPRRWYFEYVCGVLEEKRSVQALYGRVFHEALEALHSEVRVPSDWLAENVLERLNAHLGDAFERSRAEFSSRLEWEISKLRARRVAEHYVRWLFEEAADAPFEISELEARRTLSAGGHEFVGYIDRIDRPATGGPITIVDYKTGRIEDDPEEYLRRIRSGDEAQLALYYAMSRERGDAVARIALVSVRDTRDRAWMLALDIADDEGRMVTPRRERSGVIRTTCSARDLRASLDALVERADLLTREGVPSFGPGVNPPCRYCTYERACRERPAEEERIFAR